MNPSDAFWRSVYGSLESRIDEVIAMDWADAWTATLTEDEIVEILEWK